MVFQGAVSENLVCPGCHFGCKLVKYQCGRGKEFFDLAASGGELPTRHGRPVATPSERAARLDGMPPLDDRVMFCLMVLANRLQQHHQETGEQKMAFALSRAGSFMTLPILAKRTMLSPSEFDDALEAAKRAGLVEVEVAEEGDGIARLTETGKEQVAAWKAERDARTAEFLVALDDGEKETLERLLRKTLSTR